MYQSVRPCSHARLIMLMMEHGHEHQEPGYGYHDANSQQWIEGSTGFHSHHQSPVQEHNGFAFSPIPMEPMYTPAASSMPPPRTTYQQLQPLITPQWPSQLASQSSYHTALFPSAPIQSTPVSTPVSAPATTGRSSSTPRKTLTDADRRRMCLYAEEHPTVKQTEIGGERVETFPSEPD